jgi:hypothetical protein
MAVAEEGTLAWVHTAQQRTVVVSRTRMMVRTRNLCSNDEEMREKPSKTEKIIIESN